MDGNGYKVYNGYETELQLVLKEIQAQELTILICTRLCGLASSDRHSSGKGHSRCIGMRATKSKATSRKERPHKQLSEALKQHRHELHIIMGDFNARLH